MRLNRRLLLAALSATLCTPALAADNSLLTSTAPDRAAKLEAAAKAEGEISLYTSLASKDLQPLIDPFEKKYGIKVNVWRASGDSVLQRVIQEQKAGRNTVDIVEISAPELEALSREGLLQPTESPYFADLVEGSIPKHKQWVGNYLSVWVQGYNTDTVSAGELPKSYADLLDPKWKGKLGFEVEDIDWFTAVVKEMGEDKGLEYFRNLVRTNGLSIRKGHSQLNNLVVAGEVPIGLTLYSYMPAQAKADGAPIDWFAIEPAIARANGSAVIKMATHPNAAALFSDYMLSDAQRAMPDLNYVPASTKVKSPLADTKIQLTDPADKLDNARKWEPLYQKIVIQGNAG